MFARFVSCNSRFLQDIILGPRPNVLIARILQRSFNFDCSTIQVSLIYTFLQFSFILCSFILSLLLYLTISSSIFLIISPLSILIPQLILILLDLKINSHFLIPNCQPMYLIIICTDVDQHSIYFSGLANSFKPSINYRMVAFILSKIYSTCIFLKKLVSGSMQATNNKNLLERFIVSYLPFSAYLLMLPVRFATLHLCFALTVGYCGRRGAMAQWLGLGQRTRGCCIVISLSRVGMVCVY